MKNKPWVEGNRLRTGNEFYGVVNSEGHWCDSSESFETAIHWAVLDANMNAKLDTLAELKWMRTEGKRLGYSIIHSTLLKKLWNADLIR